LCDFQRYCQDFLWYRALEKRWQRTLMIELELSFHDACGRKVRSKSLGLKPFSTVFRGSFRCLLQKGQKDAEQLFAHSKTDECSYHTILDGVCVMSYTALSFRGNGPLILDRTWRVRRCYVCSIFMANKPRSGFRQHSILGPLRSSNRSTDLSEHFASCGRASDRAYSKRVILI
jgi:hypothetical protein